MAKPEQRTKNEIRNPKNIGVPSFMSYIVSCRDRNNDLVDLEISPFSVLVGATSTSRNKNLPIEQGLSIAMLDVVESIEENFTILGIIKNEKNRD